MMLALVLSTSGNRAVFSKETVDKFMRSWETEARIVTICVKDTHLTITASYNEEANAVKEWLSPSSITH